MSKPVDPARVLAVKRLLTKIQRSRTPDERERLSRAVLAEVRQMDAASKPASQRAPETQP